jgi:translation initiation factor IF-2
MEKVRVYEVAKEVGLTNKELVTKIRALGMDVSNHMSSLEAEEVLRIKRALDKERQQNLVEEKIQPGLTRRRSRGDGGPPRPRPIGPAGAESTTGPAAAVSASSTSAAPLHEASQAEPEVREAPLPAAASAEPGEATASGAHEAAETDAVWPPPEVIPVVPVQVAPPEVEAPEPPMATSPTPPLAAHAPQTPAAPDRVAATPPPGRPAPEAQGAGRPTPVPPSPQVPRPGHPVPPPPGYRVPVQARPPQPGQPGGPPGAPGARPGSPYPGARPLPGISVGGERRGPVRPPPSPPGANKRRELVSKRDLDQRDRFRSKGKKKAVAGKKQKSTLVTMPAQHKRIIKVEEVIQVAELARQMSLKATEVLKKLFVMGMTSVNINQSIDAETAAIVASEFGYEVSNVAFQEDAALGESEDEEADLQARAPVVTIMGHVDHGKTSLLDSIRKANVAAGESGGITQHIGAYEVHLPPQDGQQRKVVFLDTPGHEAFTAMRARGAEATDIVVLVVAADDGPMPQTIEAVNHAKAAEVPIIVAVNKIDKPQATPEKVRFALMEQGLVPTGDMGGDTEYVNVSAKTKQGIDQLLETILLQAEVLELQANPNKAARGVIIEAKLDRARGPMATVLVQEGTLKIGDPVVSGQTSGKIRAMLNDRGEPVQSAGPSTPVEVLGLEDVPAAGDVLNAVADEKTAKDVAERRSDKARQSSLGKTSRVSLQDLFAQMKEGSQLELKVVLKGDVQGSVEALKDALIRLSTDLVTVKVIHDGVGGITESDVSLAAASKAIIVGFHVRPAGKASQLAEQERVEIKLYDIIYDAIDEVKKAMVGLLAPERREKVLGRAEVRQVFNIPKFGNIAGCNVTDGVIKRSSQVRLIRDSVPVTSGKLDSLRRFKDDVREVQQGYECGIHIENFNDVKVGDVIEAFEFEEIAPSLGTPVAQSKEQRA